MAGSTRRVGSTLVVRGLAAWILLFGAVAYANGPAGEPSLQGYSGLLNIPDALVTSEGDAVAAYTNERDPRFRLSANSTALLSLGLFPYAEVTGRITDTGPGGIEDLSV